MADTTKSLPTAHVVIALLASAVITTGSVLGAFDRILMPGIREQARSIAEAAVKSHVDGPPHPSAANQQDISYIRERLQQLATKSDVEILSMKITGLSTRIEQLEKHHQ